MAKHMLIDATHPEEIRVVVVDGKRLEEFDIELASKKQLKGNIYLAKVTRVEPSLQAAFVEYGGNRHGFLAFSEIHPDYYRIPVADREALLAEEAREAAAESAREDARDAAAEARSTRRRPGRGQAREDADAAPDDTRPDADHDHHRHDDHDHDDREGGEDDRESGEDDREGGEDGREGGNRVPQELWPAQALGFAGDRLTSPEAYDDFEDAEDSGSGMPAGSPAAEDVSSHGQAEVTEAGASPETPAESADADRRLDAPLVGDVPAPDGNGANGENGASEARGPEPVMAEAKPVSVEIIGGDEADEVQPRRSTRALRSYKIQEVIKRRQVMLVQVTKEERGTKGAALTTYLSLAGRYCVLMPNTARGGGVSRKISSPVDRKRLKAILEELDIPEGMAVIIRTAGAERSKAELKRDYEYLLRLWDEIRELTLKSTAPSLVYEEANLIKRSIRDLYSRDLEDVIVDGEEGYKVAKSFMRTLTPSHAKRVQLYRDTTPLFHRHQVESQLDAIHNPVVQLKSGGYIVINSTEALVAIDVNSGRATRERNIEETAYKTNLEAAEEIARQLRLRDLAGLIVIDFIDMEESRHNAAVERRLKESMRNDRARIQIGRISAFGLLELSRQRMRPSLFETSTEICQHCRGTGHVRSTESTVLHVLRSIEDECLKSRAVEGLSVAVPTAVALYILNHKRKALAEIELRHGMRIFITGDDHLIPPEYRVERIKALAPGEQVRPPVMQATALPAPDDVDDVDLPEDDEEEAEAEAETQAGARAETDAGGDERRRKRPRRRRRGRDRGRDGEPATEAGAERGRGRNGRPAETHDEGPDDEEDETGAADGEAETAAPEQAALASAAGDDSGERRRRRRGRRGGRRRRRGGETGAETPAGIHGDAEGEDGELDAGSDADGLRGEDAAAPEAAAGSSAGDEAAPRAEQKGRRRRRGRGRQPDAVTETAAGEADDGAEAEDMAAGAAARDDATGNVGTTPWSEPQERESQPAAAADETPAAERLSPGFPQGEAGLEQAPAEEDAPAAPEPPAPAPVAVEPAPVASAPAGPPRRGWWRRLAQ